MKLNLRKIRFALFTWVLFDLLLGYAGIAAAQSGQFTPQVATNQVQFQLLNPPISPSGVNVQLTGTPGPSSKTLYFWLISKFAVGNSSPSGPFPGFNAPAALNSQNFFTVTWQPVLGAANGYDLLMTSTPAAPTGACGCAVATGIAGTSQTVQSNSTSAYTVNTIDPNTLTVVMDTEVVGGAAHLIIKQNNVQIADLSSLAGGSNSLTTLNIINGGSITGYSDNLITQQFVLNASNGFGTLKQLNLNGTGESSWSMADNPGGLTAAAASQWKIGSQNGIPIYNFSASSITGNILLSSQVGVASGNPAALGGVAIAGLGANGLLPIAQLVTNPTNCNASTFPKGDQSGCASASGGSTSILAFTPHVGAGAAVNMSTGSFVNVDSQNIPGGTIPAGSCMWVTAWFKHAGANTVIYQWIFGGVASAFNSTFNATTSSFWRVHVCNAPGQTGTNTMMNETLMSGTGGQNGPGITTLNVDTTVAQTIALQAQGTTGDTVTPQGLEGILAK
jgi:hypothetical protein